MCFLHLYLEFGGGGGGWDENYGGGGGREGGAPDQLSIIHMRFYIEMKQFLAFYRYMVPYPVFGYRTLFSGMVLISSQHIFILPTTIVVEAVGSARASVLPILGASLLHTGTLSH